MKKILQWLFSRKVVVFWLGFVTVYDVIFTYVVFRLYPSILENNGELNSAINYLIRTYGLEYGLLLIVPLVMGLIILLGYRFWNFKPLRYYLYFLFMARIGLFVYNFFVIFSLLKS